MLPLNQANRFLAVSDPLFGRDPVAAYNGGAMHELAVTESILDIVCRHAAEAGAEKVVRIHLVIGELSSIVDDSVQFYFDFLSQDSCARGAELSFRRIEATVECGFCEHAWSPKTGDWKCPECGAMGARVVRGNEFYVDSIEVE